MDIILNSIDTHIHVLLLLLSVRDEVCRVYFDRNCNAQCATVEYL